MCLSKEPAAFCPWSDGQAMRHVVVHTHGHWAGDCSTRKGSSVIFRCVEGETPHGLFRMTLMRGPDTGFACCVPCLFEHCLVLQVEGRAAGGSLVDRASTRPHCNPLQGLSCHCHVAVYMSSHCGGPLLRPYVKWNTNTCVLAPFGYTLASGRKT